MRYSYAREKFGVAVNNMATGTGDIRERIWGAYLNFHTLSVKDFPDYLKEDWNYIHDILMKEEPTYNDKGDVVVGKVQNSLSKMDTDACVDLAQRICDLNTKLHWEEE